MSNIESEIVAYCPNSACKTPIKLNHSYHYCTSCYNQLPPAIKDKLPELTKSMFEDTGAASILIGSGIVILFLSIIGYFWANGYLKDHPLNGLGTFIGQPDSIFSMAVSIFDWSKFTAILGGLLMVGGFVMKAIGNAEPLSNKPASASLTTSVPQDQNNQKENESTEKPQRDKGAPTDVAAYLRLLSDLKKDGILTEEEFQEKKKELLGRF